MKNQHFMPYLLATALCSGLLLPAKGSETAQTATAAQVAAADVPAEGTQHSGAKTAKADAKSAQGVFAEVKTRRHKWTLGQLNDYAAKKDWAKLGADTLRMVWIEQGSITDSMQVDLLSGKVTLWTGSDAPRNYVLSKMDLSKLVGDVEGDDMKDLAEENIPGGGVGNTMFLEANWQGKYFWRMHWSADKAPGVLEGIWKRAISSTANRS